ncbi:MAG: dihydrolipoamide acetyltransferase family protein [Planctomycetota bacterium]
MSKRVDFLLPDLGEGVHEAEIISWKVKVGDTVEEMDTLAEMETDKALVEVPSPFSGKIVALHGEEGEIAHVGKPIVSFENATQGGKPVTGDPDKIAAEAIESGDRAAEESEPTPHSQDRINRADQADHAAHQPKPAGAAGTPSSNGETREDAGTVVGTMEGQPRLGADGKVMATPAVRRLAKELGVDINTIVGTGRGGRVTASDVHNAKNSGTASTGGGAATATEAAPAAVPSQPASPPAAQPQSQPVSTLASATAPAPAAPVKVDATGTAQRVPFRGVRKKIAESLDRSVKTAVHFTVMDAADVSELNKLRKQQAAATGEKVSFLPFIIQAVCRALKRFPALNANVDDERAEILIKGVMNLGIAVDTDHGLMVPVIEGADRLGVLPLQREVNDIAEKCRSRTIAVDRLKGGTFTISNVGSYGGAFATPIINYPEVGIIAAGRAKEKVMVRNGGIYVGLEMPLSLSCDHRVVDGAEGARMLNYVVQLLENPQQLLTPAGH